MKSIIMWNDKEPQLHLEDGSRIGIVGLLNQLFDRVDELELRLNDATAMLAEHLIVDLVDEPIPVFGPDDPYDPRDDTFAMGKECPNCGAEDIITGNKSGQFVCKECHHAWPYEETEIVGPSAPHPIE